MRGWLCLLALAGCDRVFGIGDPYEDASRVADTNGDIPMSSSVQAVLGCNTDQMSGFFDGLIDDVYIFDRPLTGNEVSILYAAH